MKKVLDIFVTVLLVIVIVAGVVCVFNAREEGIELLENGYVPGNGVAKYTVVVVKSSDSTTMQVYRNGTISDIKTVGIGLISMVKYTEVFCYMNPIDNSVLVDGYVIYK